jgi:hypothetical protein
MTTKATMSGEPVEILRDVAAGEEGFDPANPKCVIRLADGTEKTVSLVDVTLTPEAPAADEPTGAAPEAPKTDPAA